MGALAITGSLHHVDKDLLGWWLCERQVKSGGLNGRPEKLPDVSDCFVVYPFLSKENLTQSPRHGSNLVFIPNTRSATLGGFFLA